MTAERRSREGPAFSSLKAALGAGWVCAIGADWLGEGRLVDGFAIHTFLRSAFRAPFLDRNQIPHSPQDRQNSLEKPALSRIASGRYISLHGIDGERIC